MGILISIALILLSGVLYRLGGAGNIGDRFDVLRTTKTRDWGVSFIVALLLIPSNFWGIFLAMGVTYGVLTMGYGGKGEPKNEQSFLYRHFGEYVFYAVGFLFGLSIFSFAIAEHLTGNVGIWYPFIGRILILTGLIPLIHNFRRPILGFDSAQVEEFGRGVAITSTLLLILI